MNSLCDDDGGANLLKREREGPNELLPNPKQETKTENDNDKSHETSSLGTQNTFEGNGGHVHAANGSNNTSEFSERTLLINKKAKTPLHTASASTAAVGGTQPEEKQEEVKDHKESVINRIIECKTNGITGVDAAGDTGVFVTEIDDTNDDNDDAARPGKSGGICDPPASSQENDDSEENINIESLLEGAFEGYDPDGKASQDSATWYSRLGSNEQKNIDLGVDSILRASRRIAVRRSFNKAVEESETLIKFFKERFRQALKEEKRKLERDHL